MKTTTSSQKNSAIHALIWLLPTPVEAFVYVLIALVTLAVSNIDVIKQFFFISSSTGLKEAILGSLESLLTGFLGAKTAATLVTGIFWGIVGMIVYVLLWLLGNFSTELSNDLAITRFMHPKGTDTYEPLKRLVLKLVFHVFVIILIIVYSNLLITVLLPIWATEYAELIDHWPQSDYIWVAAGAFAAHFFALHLIVILFRLLVLRKRVFGS